MTAETDIAHIGMLIGDRTRAAMLTTLLRGDALPASDRVAQAVARPGPHRTVHALFAHGSSGRRVANPRRRPVIDLDLFP